MAQEKVSLVYDGRQGQKSSDVRDKTELRTFFVLLGHRTSLLWTSKMLDEKNLNCA